MTCERECYEERECARCYGEWAECRECGGSGRAFAYVYSRVRREVHHRLPRCLLTLRDKAEAHAEIDGEGMQLWMDYEWECHHFGIDPDIPRDDLARMIENSTYYVSGEDHRDHHAEDFKRWGKLGGLETCRRYGRPYFRLLALCRWSKTTPEELAAYREEITARS